MRGYHYTSIVCALKIREQGIIPYIIRNEGLAHLQKYGTLPDPLWGIWLWTENPVGISHIGNIIFQVSSKGCFTIVKLGVIYDEGDILRARGDDHIDVTHSGVIINDNNHMTVNYHQEEPAVIITRPILPEDVEIIGVYDLEKLLQ